MGGLSAKRRQVIVRLYGLDGCEPMETVEIARAQGVTRQCVQAVKENALRHMRTCLGIQKVAA